MYIVEQCSLLTTEAADNQNNAAEQKPKCHNVKEIKCTMPYTLTI